MNLEQLRKQAKELLRAARARRCRSARPAGRARADPGPRAAGPCAGERLSQLAGARRRGRGERGCLRQSRDREPSHPCRAHARSPPGDRARPVGGRSCSGVAGTAIRTRPAARELGADPVRLPFVLRLVRSSPAELLERGADPNATFENEYGADVGALRRGRRRPRPRADQDSARGRSEPR